MIKSNRKRASTHWKVALLLLGFLGSIEFSGSAPANPDKSKEKMPSLSSPGRSSDPEIGSPSELAWQAWLLVDPQSRANSGLDSASLLRRITPKSVFIAPQLEACAEGYSADSMGRCIKVALTINQQEHNDFILKQLNKLFSKNQESSNKKPSSNGPLQLNIPLFPESSKHESKDSEMETPDDETPQGAIPLETKNKESVFNTRAEINKTRDSVNKKNDDRKGDNEKTFFLGISNSTLHKKDDQEDSSSPAFVVPVADFIDEVNETTSAVVDYKIPLVIQSLLNRPLEHGSRQEAEPSQKPGNSTNSSPGLVTLATSTVFPFRDEVTNDADSQESTSSPPDTEMDNVTDSPTLKVIIRDDASDVSEMETWKNESDVALIQGMKKNGTSETDAVYSTEESEPDLEEQEEYVDTTEVVEEDSGESEDEILKHGEAGMTIPIENQDLVWSDKQQKKINKPTEYYQLTETTTAFYEDSNFVTTTEGGEESGSNVSSEVSINKDFVLEPTYLDASAGKAKNSTKHVSANHTASHDVKVEDFVLFEAEKKPIPELKVVFSSQDNQGSSVYGRKRDSQLFKPNSKPVRGTQTTTTTTFKNNSLFRPPNLEPKPPEFGTIRPFPVIRRRGQDFVRFPSDDVNSIHSPESKSGFSFPREESTTSIKNNESQNQKQHNWWGLAASRPEHQQSHAQMQQASANRPMLLNFWGRMPLQTDFSLDPRYAANRHEESREEKQTSSRSSRVPPSRRTNFQKETSSHDIKRVLPQKARRPIGG